MEETIQFEIPLEWMRGLPEDALTRQHIVRLGIKRFKFDRAIQMYRDSVGSPSYIAEQMGINKQDLIRERRMRDIESDFSEETIRGEIEL